MGDELSDNFRPWLIELLRQVLQCPHSRLIQAEHEPLAIHTRVMRSGYDLTGPPARGEILNRQALSQPGGTRHTMRASRRLHLLGELRVEPQAERADGRRDRDFDGSFLKLGKAPRYHISQDGGARTVEDVSQVFHLGLRLGVQPGFNPSARAHGAR